MSKKQSSVATNRDDRAFGIPLQHESVGIGKSGSDMSEHLKGRKQLQRARDIRDASVSNPAEDLDKKARSKSKKGFLRTI